MDGHCDLHFLHLEPILLPCLFIGEACLVSDPGSRHRFIESLQQIINGCTVIASLLHGLYCAALVTMRISAGHLFALFLAWWLPLSIFGSLISLSNRTHFCTEGVFTSLYKRRDVISEHSFALCKIFLDLGLSAKHKFFHNITMFIVLRYIERV